jgi:hypothetical protein
MNLKLQYSAITHTRTRYKNTLYKNRYLYYPYLIPDGNTRLVSPLDKRAT